MKQTACKLCGKAFVCDNGMWSTTCTCAKDRPDELKAAQATDNFEDDILRNAEQIANCHGLDPRHKLLIQMVRELHELATRFRLHRFQLIQAANGVVHRGDTKEALNQVVAEVTGYA